MYACMMTGSGRFSVEQNRLEVFIIIDNIYSHLKIPLNQSINCLLMKYKK